METLPILVGAVIAALLGTIVGFKLLAKTDRSVVMKSIYTIMILAGLSLIFF